MIDLLAISIRFQGDSFIENISQYRGGRHLRSRAIRYTGSPFIVFFSLLPMTSVDAYAKEFGALSESAFETEACIRLEHTVNGFQRVPAKPQGDGGLDGFSHKGKRGYCCYGPILTSFTKPKDLEKRLLKSFQAICVVFAN